MSRDRARELAEAQAGAAEAARSAAPPAMRGPRAPSTPLPGDVKGLLAGVVVVALAGVGWLAFGPRPDPVIPVLGFVDAGPPPVPKPAPSPEPVFPLPWWK